MLALAQRQRLLCRLYKKTFLTKPGKVGVQKLFRYKFFLWTLLGEVSKDGQEIIFNQAIVRIF